MARKFIDISDFNNITSLDILKSEVEFVIVKATEGATFAAKTLDTKYTILKNNNIPCGFYHFLRSTSSPKEQAQNFYNHIKEKDYTIKPVLDIEHDELLGNAEFVTNQFLKYFKELCDDEVIIYSYTNFIEDNFSKEFCSNNKFWIAQYKTNTSPEDAPKIEKCKNVIAWQYTNKEYFNFMGSPTDASYLYSDEFYKNKQNVNTNSINNSKDNNIYDLQKELNLQGFKDKNGHTLVEDGIAGELTLSTCPTLIYTSKSNITKWVQKQLNITADGIFGRDTLASIKRYQQDNGLKIDGIVGKETWRKLLHL